MTQRGPAAKPVELKALEGNRGHRPLNLSETFRPEVGLPPIPSGMSAGARKVWRRLSPELLRYNLMSVVYSDAFEDLCESVATVKLLRRSLAGKMARLHANGQDVSEAFEVKSPGGMPVQAPIYQTLKAERNHMQSCLARFGLAPSESARVTASIRAQLQLFPGGAGEPEKPPPADPTKPLGFADFD